MARFGEDNGLSADRTRLRGFVDSGAGETSADEGSEVDGAALRGRPRIGVFSVATLLGVALAAGLVAAFGVGLGVAAASAEVAATLRGRPLGGILVVMESSPNRSSFLSGRQIQMQRIEGSQQIR